MEWVYTEEHRRVLGFSKWEVNELCKELQPQKKAIQKKYEHYQDLHDIGEATDRQQTLRLQYKERLDFLNSIIEEANQINNKTRQ